MNYIVGGGTAYEVNLLLLSHSLEKGMGLESPRKGFGVEKANSLFELLKSFALKKSAPNEYYEYNEGMSVLEAYIQFSESTGMDVSNLKNSFLDLSEKNPFHRLPAGYEIYNSKEAYEKIDLKEIEYFISSRHSVRSYVYTPVERKIVENAICLASQFPSACNRQPVKVFWTNREEAVKQVDKYIPGNRGFEGEIPNWAFIAADRSMFGSDEVLQWYVNGGIFASYFILSLYANGIASCIFQMPISWKYIDDIKAIAEIPDHYSIVCAVGFGYPKDSVKRIMATRKPVQDISAFF